MKRFTITAVVCVFACCLFFSGTAHACPYPSVAWYFDSISSHGSYEFPLDLEPCEEVFIIVITDTSPSLGAALKLRIHNSLGDEIASEIWSAYGSGVTTTLDDLGMRGDECHPAYGVFESLVWDVYSFLIIVINIPRPDTMWGEGVSTRPIPWPSFRPPIAGASATTSQDSSSGSLWRGNRKFTYSDMLREAPTSGLCTASTCIRGVRNNFRI